MAQDHVPVKGVEVRVLSTAPQVQNREQTTRIAARGFRLEVELRGRRVWVVTVWSQMGLFCKNLIQEEASGGDGGPRLEAVEQTVGRVVHTKR